MQPPDGDLFHLSGEFLEIDPPSLLVYTFRWQIDAVESLAWILPVVFAIFQRVRPYNKYLRYELDTHPFQDARWARFDLVAALERILATGDADAQRAIFAMVETDVRQLGFGETVDGWGEELPFIRVG